MGEAFFRFEDAVGDGDGVGVALFDERFRCLRDELGVGSGSSAFLIFVPSDSSAGRAVSMIPNRNTRIRNNFITVALGS